MSHRSHMKQTECQLYLVLCKQASYERTYRRIDRRCGDLGLDSDPSDSCAHRIASWKPANTAAHTRTDQARELGQKCTS